MEGYWRASVDGIEVARGPSPEDAHAAATALGHDGNLVVLEYVYESARVGVSGIY